MAEDFADTSGADILSEMGEGGCQNPKHVPVFINGVPSGCASISHFDDYYNPGSGGGGPTINIPSFESVWGELPEGADGWKIGDLNGDGVRETYAYTLSDTGVETPHTVYGTDADGNVVTTPYDEWNAPDLTELIEQYGEDAVNDLKGKYDELVDFIGNIPEDPLGSLKKMAEIFIEGATGIDPNCTSTSTTGPVGNETELETWLLDCVNIGILIDIGIPGLPGLGGIFKNTTLRDIKEAAEKVGSTLEDFINGNPTCGEKNDQECTPEQILKDLGDWVVRSVEDIFGDVSGEIDIETILGKLGGIFGPVLSGIIYDQFKDLINGEIEDVIGIPVIPFAPLQECEDKDLVTIEDPAGSGNFKCGGCKQEGFTPTGPKGECVDPNAVDPFDETQCVEEDYFNENKADCEAAGYVNCAGGENSQAQETTGGIIKGTLDDCDVIQDPQCIGDGRWDGEKCVCPDGTDKAGEEEPLDGDCSDDSEPECDNNAINPDACNDCGDGSTPDQHIDGDCNNDRLPDDPTQQEGDPCQTGAPLNAEGKVGPAPYYECVPNEGTTCTDPETGKDGNIEDGQCVVPGTTTQVDCTKPRPGYTPSNNPADNAAFKAWQEECFETHCTDGSTKDSHVNWDCQLGLTADCQDPQTDEQKRNCGWQECGTNTANPGVLVQSKDQCGSPVVTCQDPNRQKNNDQSCGENCNSGFDQPAGYDVCTPIEQLCADEAEGYGPDNKLCGTTSAPDCTTITDANADACGKKPCPDGTFVDKEAACGSGLVVDCNKPKIGYTPSADYTYKAKWEAYSAEYDETCGTGGGGVVTCQDPNATNYEQQGECGPCKDLYDKPDGYDVCTLIETLCQDPNYAEGNELCEGPCDDGEVEFLDENGEVFCDSPCAYNDQIASSSPNCVAPECGNGATDYPDCVTCPSGQRINPETDQCEEVDCTLLENALFCGWVECEDGTMAPTLGDCEQETPCSDPTYAANNPLECGWVECPDGTFAETREDCEKTPQECANGAIDYPACTVCPEGQSMDAEGNCVTTVEPPPPETGGGGGGGAGGAFSPFLAGITYTPQPVPEIIQQPSGMFTGAQPTRNTKLVGDSIIQNLFKEYFV